MKLWENVDFVIKINNKKIVNNSSSFQVMIIYVMYWYRVDKNKRAMQIKKCKHKQMAN